MRIHVTYADENEPFRFAMPEAGVIGSLVRQVNLVDWGDNWSLLELESSFTYNGREHTQMLVRSRSEGSHVGAPEPIPVFVLLLPTDNLLAGPDVASRDFEQTPWCMAETLPG